MTARRDAMGLRRLFVDRSSTRWSTHVRPLIRGAPRLDRAGVAFAWGLGDEQARTCLEGVERVPPGCRVTGPAPLRVEPEPLPAATGTLIDALLEATRAALQPGAVLALSGGLDSALILALARELGLPLPPTLSLLTPWPEYDERSAVVETARCFGLEPTFERVSAEDVLLAVEDAVTAIETCLYNLHPVGRLLLARAARRRGFRTLVTGDGADQAFAGTSGERYLPIVSALVESAGLRLSAPFCDPRVLSHARCARDPAKTALRAIASALSPSAPWSARPKLPRLMPAIDLSTLFQPAWAARVSAELELPLSLDDDRGQVRWATLASLARAFGSASCVA